MWWLVLLQLYLVKGEAFLVYKKIKLSHLSLAINSFISEMK